MCWILEKRNLDGIADSLGLLGRFGYLHRDRREMIDAQEPDFESFAR